MLNFQLIMTEKDRREAAKLERRRMIEEERKKRIFNPRARQIGIDEEVLQSQIEEKKRRELEQQRIDKIFEDQLKKSDQVAVAMERKEKEERQQLEKEINDFRRYYQRPEDRREFDLNDPNLLRKQLPARLHDDDPRLGPSCAQKFEGEDRVSEQRQKIQGEQIKAWLDQQLMEKEQAEKERKAAEDAYKAAVIARDQRAVELEKIENDCRRRLDEACLRYNKALAEAKMCEKLDMERKTNIDNSAEIYNILTSDMMIENPDVSQSNLGAGRKIGYLYKGMSDEEKRQVRLYQMQQIEEAKNRKELEKRKEKEFEDYLNGTQKTILLIDRELEMKEKQKLKELAEENKRLAEEQKHQQKYLEKIVYSNVPTTAYFEQFNKSSR